MSGSRVTIAGRQSRTIRTVSTAREDLHSPLFCPWLAGDLVRFPRSDGAGLHIVESVTEEGKPVLSRDLLAGGAL